MEVYLLILQLSLPGHDEPIHGEIQMPSFAECSLRATLFLETFRKQTDDDGGQAMAGCMVIVPRRQDANNQPKEN